MNPFYKNLALWMVIGLVVVLLFNVFGGLSGEKPTFEPNYSDFLKNVDAGRVQSVTIRGNLVTGKLKDGGEFRTYVVESQDFMKLLRDKNVSINVRPVDQNPWYMSVLISWFPMILFIGVWIFFMRQMQGGGAKALSFGKARARLIS
jgi:cell division protease FtsH